MNYEWTRLLLVLMPLRNYWSRKAEKTKRNIYYHLWMNFQLWICCLFDWPKVFISWWSDDLTEDRKFYLPNLLIHQIWSVNEQIICWLIKFEVSDITKNAVKSFIGNISYQYRLCCSPQVCKNKLFYEYYSSY